MERVQRGILGLPKEFSEEPEQKKAQVWQAIRVGYDRVDQRFGKWAAIPWEPNLLNTFFYESVDSHADTVLGKVNLPRDLDSKLMANAKLNLSSTGLFFLSSPEGVLHVNPRALESPLKTALGAASIIINAWGNGSLTRWRLVHPEEGEFQSRVINEFMDNTARRANDALIDYSAREALGLLNPPLKRLSNVDLIRGAILALIAKQFALALKPNINSAIFRITQGKYTEREVDALNKKMGLSPEGGQGSFYISGFLEPLGNFLDPLPPRSDRFFKKACETRVEHLKHNLAWTAQGLGLSVTSLPRTWQRPDVSMFVKRE